MTADGSVAVNPTGLPVPALPLDPETRPFFEAAAQGRLTLKRCGDCGSVIWYPRAICPQCYSTNTEWFDASGRGTIYSYTFVRKGFGAFADAGPYVLAYIELAEGPRIMTNIAADDPSALEIGRAVEVVFDKAEDGAIAIPRFRPA